MPAGPLTLVNCPCECGGTLIWTRRGLFRRVWRQECLCGRCGPWRLSPETERADAFMLRGPIRVPGGVRPGIRATTTPPPSKK